MFLHVSQLFGPPTGPMQSRLPQHCEVSVQAWLWLMHVWQLPPGVHISPLQQSVWAEQASESFLHCSQLPSMQVVPLQQSEGWLQESPGRLQLWQVPPMQFMPLQHSESSLQVSPFSRQLAQVPLDCRQTSGVWPPLQQSLFVLHPGSPEEMQHEPPTQEPEQQSSPLVHCAPDATQASQLPPMQRRLPQQSSLVPHVPVWLLQPVHMPPMQRRLPQHSEAEEHWSPVNLQTPLTPMLHSSARFFAPSSTLPSIPLCE